jgi:hypothetical protein
MPRQRITPEDRVLLWAATADPKTIESVLRSAQNILNARRPQRRKRKDPSTSTVEVGQ